MTTSTASCRRAPRSAALALAAAGFVGCGPPPAATTARTGTDAPAAEPDRKPSPDDVARDLRIAELEAEGRRLKERIEELERRDAAKQAESPTLPAQPALPTDPRERFAFGVAARLKELPGLRPLHFVERFADPWIVLQQFPVFEDAEDRHKNPARTAKAEVLVARECLLLEEIHRRFRELFGERFRLPELADHGRVLVAVVGWDEEAFGEIHEATVGNPPEPILRSTYSRSAQALLSYLGEDSIRAQDVLPVKDGYVQKLSDQMICYEASLQLVHELGAILRGKPLAAGAPDDRPRRPLWFECGLGEFMGAIETDRQSLVDLRGARFRHNRLPLDRIQFVRGDERIARQRETAKAWTIDRLEIPDEQWEIPRAIGRYDRWGLLTNPYATFSARSWCLVHFLWNYDGGRYRTRFLDYMETVLRGEDGPETFARCIRQGTDAERKRFEEEFEWYWDRCLARRVGWRDEGQTRPWNTETDPPEGTYDPNPEEDSEKDK